MDFQFKKYFLILFSVVSMAVYSNIDQKDTRDLSQLAEGTNAKQLPKIVIQVSKSQQMFDACLAYKNVVIDRCVSVQEKCKKMIDTISADPGCQLESGLTLGGLLGVAQVATLKCVKKFPRIQAAAMFGVPTAVVSYLIALRNQRIHELEWTCKQSKDSKKSE